jgi:hypothetical protein
MNAVQAWEIVLHELEREMPRASFDTWVRDTEALSLEESLLTVAVRNTYARDWLAERLTSTVQRLLAGILNQETGLQFVVPGLEQAPEAEEPEDQAGIAIQPVQWLDYEKIVQPRRQVVVKGYLRRLGLEIGPKAIWLYIGFHQAAWRVANQGRAGLPLHSREVMRFSGLSFGAFWRALRSPEMQRSLGGLVERLDPPGARQYRRGRDGRPHRLPVRYQVCMTPRLTGRDTAALYAQLKTRLSAGISLPAALQELLAMDTLLDWPDPEERPPDGEPLYTVMDLARLVSNAPLTPDCAQLAQELQRRITNQLGDIHIPHYFLTHSVHAYNLTPAQAWLVTVARDLAYLNWRTGERREVVTFKGGYREMAALVGSCRPKSVQAWFNPHWRSQRRGGEIGKFLQELDMPEGGSYLDHRVESMPRSFRVNLDEPLDADGSHNLGAHGSISAGAHGSHSPGAHGSYTLGAHGSHMAGANGTVKNSFKHLKNTHTANTATTQHGDLEAGAAAPLRFELRRLLGQNKVHPRVQKELLDCGARVHAFVSWVLYAGSPEGRFIADPLGYTLSRLRQDPQSGAGGAFDQFADLPPGDLLALLDEAASSPLGLGPASRHPCAASWQAVMGYPGRSLDAVRQILFGKGV